MREHRRYSISVTGNEPFTLTEMKNWLKVDTNVSEDDDLINDLIINAREVAEHDSGFLLKQGTVIETFDTFPHTTDYLILSVKPLGSVTKVEYYDENNTLQTWDSSNYKVDTTSKPGRIGLAQNAVWPTLRDEIDAVKVTYTAGYTSTTIPGHLIQGMRHLIALWYEKRVDPAMRYPSMAGWLLKKGRIRRF